MWRSELRRLLLTDKLLELPHVMRELTEARCKFVEEQRALAVQVRELAEDHRRLVSEVRKLAEEQRALIHQVRELAQKIDALVTWQRGEAGRRRGTL
jgi:predicted  nucleic acid-binding Zn-ribbon protein